MSKDAIDYSCLCKLINLFCRKILSHNATGCLFYLGQNDDTFPASECQKEIVCLLMLFNHLLFFSILSFYLNCYFHDICDVKRTFFMVSLMSWLMKMILAVSKQYFASFLSIQKNLYAVVQCNNFLWPLGW